ncbi:MAG: DDE-type integrase/transposase/recombinase [Deltaproteobacteria bacterium]|nr:DDE-type integrase/transposase/recombinase [Deltaproteobacteria bacterium]
MDKASPKTLQNWAVFRFSVVGGLLARPPEKGELQKELQLLAERTWRHPITDQQVKFGVSTLERWYYRARDAMDPIQAMARKIRSDAGHNSAMPTSQLSELDKQYKQFPHWSYQLHFDNLAALIKERYELGLLPSYSTLRRRMIERGWRPRSSARGKQTPGMKQAAQRLEQREVRSFESGYVHQLWHLDFHHSRRRVVDSVGRWHTAVALCILDDRSRLCCHLQWYLEETAESLFHGLMQAFHKRGLPRALLTDNGSAMIAHETQNGLLHLGICHDKTLPYSPYQNGKQESFWGGLEGRLMAMLTRVDPLSLDFLNQASLAWAEQEYNRKIHDELGQSPLNQMLKGPDVSRPCVDSEALKFAFCLQERRTQRRSDGTITIKGVRFELPSRMRHIGHVFIRYPSWDLSTAWLVDPKSGQKLERILPQDKLKNAGGKRRMLPPVPGPPAPETTEPIPPLLRKILSDYAATGLPPAYLPKEGKANEQ